MPIPGHPSQCTCYKCRTKTEAESFYKRDCNHLNNQEIKFAKLCILDLFEHLLPYTTKNGMYFSRGVISIQVGKGLVHGDNSMHKHGDYGLILKYSPSFSNESKYQAYADVNKIGTSVLDRLATDIKRVHALYAYELLN